MLRNSVLAVALALGLVGEEPLVVRHATDRTVTRTFERSLTIALDSMTARLDGEEMPGHGDVTQTTSESSELVVTDRITELADGKPAKLMRRFDTIACKRSMHFANPLSGEVDDEGTEASELAGRTVQFERADDAWTAEFAEDDPGESELLEGLVAELDFAEFLPADAVAKGSTWTIPADAFARLVRPAGDLHAARESEAKLPAARLDRGALAPKWSGEIVAEYVDVDETGGDRLVEIALRVDVRAQSDLAEALRAANAKRPDDPHGAKERRIDSAVEQQTYTGEGRLIWNATQGRLQTLKLECELARTHDVHYRIEFGGEERELTQLSSFSGKETFAIEFE